MGVTLDILKISGTTPDDIDSLYILVKGTESGPLASLISLLGTLRHALFSFNPANNVNTCASVTGARKKLLSGVELMSVWGPCYQI